MRTTGKKEVYKAKQTFVQNQNHFITAKYDDTRKCSHSISMFHVDCTAHGLDMCNAIGVMCVCVRLNNLSVSYGLRQKS